MVDWELVSYVLASELRFQILIELRKNKMTPSELAEELEIANSRMSVTLKDLEENELVKCLTPNRRKSKLFTITGKGDEILEEVHELTSKE